MWTAPDDHRQTGPARTDHVRSLLRRAHTQLGVAAVLIALVVGVAAAATSEGSLSHPYPLARGLVAGVGTLVVCWGLLGVGAALVRARLDPRPGRTGRRG
jgi:hypothetical protein